MKELKEFTLKDLLFFEKMLTPQVVTYLYWIGILFSFILGLRIMFTNFSFGSFITAILFFIVGVISSRVFYELVIVLFKIYEKLAVIANEADDMLTIATKKPVAKPKAPAKKPAQKKPAQKK